MLRKKADGYKVIARFVVSYVLVMVIVLSVGSLTMRSARNMVREHAVSRMLAELEKTRDTLGARFAEMNNILTQMSYFERDIAYFVDKKPPLLYPDHHKMSELSRELNKYILSNNFIQDVSIYFEGAEIMISPHFVYGNVPQAYGPLFEYRGLSFEEWKDMLFSGQGRGFGEPQILRRCGQSRRVIPYNAPLPETEGGGRAVISILIEEKTLARHLSYIQNDDFGGNISFLLLDRNGRVLYSDGDETWAEDAGYTAADFPPDRNMLSETMAYTVCPDTGWIYAASVSPDYFAQAMGRVGKTYLAAAGLAFLIGLVIAVLLAIQTSKPIRSTLEILRSSAGVLQNARNDSEYIQATLRGIVSQNRSISQQLDAQKPILREAVMKKLLTNGFMDEKDMLAALSYTDMSLSGGGYMAGIIDFAGYHGGFSEEIYDEVSISKLVAQDVVRGCLGGGCYFCNIDDLRMAVLLQTGGETADIAGRLNQAVTELADLGVDAVFSMGNSCEDIGDIARSFEQAEKASAPSLDREPARVRLFADRKPERAECYYYPMNIEQQLINLTKMGEREKTEQLLAAICEENAREGLTREHALQLAYELRGTLIKLWGEVAGERECKECADSPHSFQNTVGSLDMGLPPCETLRQVREVFLRFCDIVGERKRSHNLELRNRILEYINLKYDDPGLCLYDVASRFGLSDKYLSDFFKEQTGENFSTYVESLRMDRIVGMLREGKLPISAIADQSGYYSANTLYKVFKRRFGISPGSYRQHYALDKQ